MQNISLVLLTEGDDALGPMYAEFFRSFPNCQISKDSVDQLGSVDCLVLPCTSSFGRSGEYVDKHSNDLGTTLQRILNVIQNQYCGEQPVSSAIVVRNSVKEVSRKFKYVAFLCLSRSPHLMSQDYAYNAMRGLMFAIRDHNNKVKSENDQKDVLFPETKIETVAVTPFVASKSTDEQKRQVIRHMSMAYKNIFYPSQKIPAEKDVALLNYLLFEQTTKTKNEKRSEIVSMLKTGELRSRGIYSDEELSILVELLQEEGELRIMAAQTIAGFLNESPSEFTVARETICSAVAQAKTGLQYLLSLAIAGSVQLHREIPPNSYEIIERIGEGTEAVVHKVRWNGKLCALKKFKGIPNHDDFIREISIMSLVNHPNLVRCYGGQTKNDNYAILSELMEDNLFNLLSKQSVKLEPYHVYKMAIQVCRGMEYLHACNLIHRDLKSVNLLVDNDLNVKVCDFGLSRLIDRERNMTGNVGTVSWIAPEIFQQEHYTEKADVYSFGIVLWELWTRRIPFEDESTFEIPLSVIRGHRPVIPDNCPKEFGKLMKTCWSGKSAKRPSFAKVEIALNKLLKSIPESPINSIFKVKSGRSNSEGIKVSPKANKRSSQRMEQSEDDKDKRSPSASGSGGSRRRSGTTQININSNSTSSSKEEREKKIKVKL